MTRKDELEKVTSNLADKWNLTAGEELVLFEAFQQVEREVLSRCQAKIESLMEKENESTDDQVWEYRDWLKAQQKELG